MKQKIASVLMILILLMCEAIIYKSYLSGDIPRFFTLAFLISAAVPMIYIILKLVRGQQIQLKRMPLPAAVIVAIICTFWIYSVIPKYTGKNTIITITATGEKNSAAKSSQVWFRIRKDGKFIDVQPYVNNEWTNKNNRLVSVAKSQPSSITLNLEYEDNLSLHFRKHTWSGIAEINEFGKVTRMDLYTDGSDGIYQVKEKGKTNYLVLIAIFLSVFMCVYSLISLIRQFRGFRGSKKIKSAKKEGDIKSLQTRKKLSFLNNPAVTVILAVMYPSLFLLQLNHQMYTTNSVIATVVIMLLVALVLSLPILVAVFFAPYRIVSLAAVLLSSGVMLVLFYSKIHAYWWAIAVAIAIVVASLSYLKGVRYINLFLSVLIIIVGINWTNSVYAAHKIRVSSNINSDGYVNTSFKEKPNIYFIMLESYHNPRTTKRLYNFDNKEFLDYMNDKGFFVPENSFSSSITTISSLSTMFAMAPLLDIPITDNSDGDAFREIIGGKYSNMVLNILKNNGYYVQYLLHGYCFLPSPSIDYEFSNRSFYDPLEVFELDFITKRIPGSNYAKQLRQTFYKRVDFAASHSKPVFTVAKFGAAHTPARFSWYPARIKALPEFSKYSAENDFTSLNMLYWKDVYIKLLNNSNSVNVNIIDYITK